MENNAAPDLAWRSPASLDDSRTTIGSGQVTPSPRAVRAPGAGVLARHRQPSVISRLFILNAEPPGRGTVLLLYEAIGF
jgi:hypothetical protein